MFKLLENGQTAMICYIEGHSKKVAHILIKAIQIIRNFPYFSDEGSQSSSSLPEVKIEPQNSPGYLQPISLTDSSALYNSWECHTPSLVKSADNDLLNKSLHNNETNLVNALVSLETESRENIAMNMITRDGIMNGFKTGASLQFDVLKQGYNTAVKRIAYFIRKIDRFQDFTLEDKRSLIGRYRKILIYSV